MTEIHVVESVPMDGMCRHRQHPKQILHEVFGRKAHLWNQREMIFSFTVY